MEAILILTSASIHDSTIVHALANFSGTVGAARSLLVQGRGMLESQKTGKYIAKDEFDSLEAEK
ncbi:MAG: hypothetical protein FJ004_08095 [Chloroflexi bacterium]|nr:hypothetical protein [Chloroflexota bacterium]